MNSRCWCARRLTHRGISNWSHHIATGSAGLPLSPDTGSPSPLLFDVLHQHKLVEVFYFDSTGCDRFAFARW